jgi:hypothetical protein
MSKSNAHETEYLLLLLNNTNAADIGDATGLRGSSTAGSLYAALHTADPGEGGNQATSECSYTGYARVPIARSGAGFTVAGNQGSLAANVDFGVKTAGSDQVATFFSIGVASAGATKIIFRGALSPTISIENGTTPRLTTGTTITED